MSLTRPHDGDSASAPLGGARPRGGRSSGRGRVRLAGDGHGHGREHAVTSERAGAQSGHETPPGARRAPGAAAGDGEQHGAVAASQPGSGPSGLLDDGNRAIIESLQRDGRLPYGTIAEEVGLSEAAVRRRVQRLREAGVMQIVAVTDPLQLGFYRQAMVGVRVEGDLRKVADKLSELDEVDYVVICAGSFDLLVEVVCEDDDALFRLLNDSFRSIPGVRSTESFVYLKLAKQTYSWGTR